jgi:hypothetical protein
VPWFVHSPWQLLLRGIASRYQKEFATVNAFYCRTVKGVGALQQSKAKAEGHFGR